MGWWSNLWKKERVIDAEEGDGFTTLAVKGRETVSDMIAILTVHVSWSRNELPRQFESLEAMSDSFTALAQKKDVQKNIAALGAEWKSLQSSLKALLKACTALPKDATDVAREQCRNVAMRVPVLILRLDGIVKTLSGSPRRPVRKAA